MTRLVGLSAHNGNEYYFTVRGIPAPKGSAKAFVIKGARPRAVVTHDSKKTKPWQKRIAEEAQCHAPKKIIDGPVRVHLNFILTRPKSVSEHKRPYPTVKPDIDKLVRTVLDGLTGIFFKDDSQVWYLTSTKKYGDPPGVNILLREELLNA